MDKITSDGMDQVVADWLGRRREAFEDVRALGQMALTAAMPFDLLRFGQHVMANMWLRWTEDTSAWQDITTKVMERSIAWGSDGFRSIAERTAVATRAANKPLRDTSTANYGSAD